MTGALYWLAVGSFRVGAYLDSESKPQLGTTGHFPPECAEDAIRAIRAVRLCILYPDNLQAELERTGLLYALCKTPR